MCSESIASGLLAGEDSRARTNQERKDAAMDPSPSRSARAKVGLTLLTAVLVVFGAGAVAAAGGPSTLTACSSKNHLRLVEDADECRGNETLVQWNAGDLVGSGMDLAGASCPEGEFVTGFDQSGGLLCAAPDGSGGDGGDGGDGGNGAVDADRDGFTTDSDCDDENATVNPGATEVYNDVDDDCDGEVDEIFAVYGSSWGTCVTGIMNTETGEPVPGYEAVGPEPEVPGDQLDNDCDGMTDEVE